VKIKTSNYRADREKYCGTIGNG